MSGDASLRPWLVIRQDDNGNRYRIGRYATRDEATQIAGRLARGSGKVSVEDGRLPRYLVEHIGHGGGGLA